ncbi:hypothetical protein AYK25_07910 [Thermoplasmatales archaeon SM1-50]|nr:MAG: hypothetical protein AYK25_07910 [Thermoplasmatales archaeon SM1-50]
MKKTNFLGIIILLFFFLSTFFFQGACKQETASSILYVGGDGPGNYSSIHNAINQAAGGSIIFVYDGTYFENLTIEKPLHVTGENKNTTIINGSGNKFVVTLAANHIVISGFTITNSEKKFPYAGIYVNSDSNTISDNILTNNYYGIHLGYEARDNLIVNNTIFHNRQCGIYFNHASYNRLIGNIVSNHPVNGFGLYEFSNDNRIINNTFSLNRYTGVNIRESYQNQVIGNTFIKDEVGMHKPSPEYQTVSRDNIFNDNGLSLEEERDAIILTVIAFDILVFFAFLVFRKMTI